MRNSLHRAVALAVFVVMALALPGQVGAAVSSGTLIKASGPAVYYVESGRRFVFPNERIFFSWYRDFSSVVTVLDADLAGYRLGGNVTYRPGFRLVKLQTDPKVYAVAPGGLLRPIGSEAVARDLFGPDWNRQVDDLSDAYFLDYRIGSPVAAAADYSPGVASNISDDLASRQAATPVVTSEFQAVQLGTWSDPMTWSAKQRPTAGAKVVIPQGVKVIFDAAATPDLKSLDVQGELEFWAESRTPLQLSAKTVKVEGALRVGTAEHPFPAQLTANINLTGNGPDADPDDGLTVAGGTVDLHGTPTAVSWTTLAVPAGKGDSKLTLTTAVDWPVGARLLVTSTSRNAAEAEVRAVAKVTGAEVTLDKPLAFGHWADSFLSAEVALLDRNVSVTGAGGGLGGRLAVTSGGRLRISDVALRGLGKSGAPGEAAVIFDGNGDSASSAISRIVLEGSGNRCVVARYSDRLAVEDSVFYGIKGHCLTGETEIETGLAFRRNLVADVKAGTEATGDLVPAAVLLHNPDATVTGNAVAGSAGHGYWYWLKEEAMKLSGTKVRPRETPLGAFTGNSVHAAAKSGLFVDDSLGQSDYAPASKAVFSGLRAVQSGDYGFWARGNALEVANAFLGDNRVGGSFAAFGATFKDSTVQGDPDSASSTLATQLGFAYQDGPVNVSNVTFRNLLPTPKRSFAAFGWVEKNSRLTDPLNAFRNAKFENAQKWLAAAPQTAAEQMSVVRDLDAGRVTTPHSPFLDFSCTPETGSVQSCPGPYAQFQVALRETASARPVTLERLDGKGSVSLEPGAAFDGTYAYFTVAEGESYRLRAPSASRLTFDYSGGAKSLVLRLAAGENFKATSAIGSTWNYDKAAGELVLKVVPGDYVDVQW